MSTLKKLKKQSRPLKLNLGCGKSKIMGCINIDIEKSCKPDLIHDFTKKELPYKKNSINEVYFFHTIEHISKRLHREILQEIHRVLEPGGRVYISYPEFTKCVGNWITNHRGMRQFWEATIYGLQRYPSDYHVCIMDSQEFTQLLNEVGFTKVAHGPESKEDYNTIVSAVKSTSYVSYEELIARSTAELRIVKK